MKPLPFYKMSGCGNDFIIIDNREQIVDEKNLTDFIQKVCRRKMSVGADGLILIEKSPTVDFKWRFFNSDGSIAEMCGNGARCAARFAMLHSIAKDRMNFETVAGVIEAAITDDRVKIKMTDPSDIEEEVRLTINGEALTMSTVNTGVPHAVMVVRDIHLKDIMSPSREIRYHDRFFPAGTNVNYLSINDDGIIDIRTYERGVEDETLACGTGVVAGAIVTAKNTGKESPICLRTKSGGLLNVYFKEKDGKFSDVFLEGDARIIYTAELQQDAWQYD